MFVQGRFTRIINTHPTTEASKPPSGGASYVGTGLSPNAASKAAKTNFNGRTSKFHYLIPASSVNVHLCYNTVSSAAARYPVPILLGWKGEGEYDAAKTHLAKLRAIQDYLHGVSEDKGKNDDDLVLIVDGYDIIMQLPPEIMIERYFTIAAEADDRLARQLNLTVEEAHAKGFKNTIFWGPDKICWPGDGNAARCWAAPVSNLGTKPFGPNSGNGEMDYNDPRWLNSGTVIAPLGDLRRYIDETMVEIKHTYNEDFENSESDQYYLANVWGRQEYYRILEAEKNKPEEKEKKDEGEGEGEEKRSLERRDGDDEHVLPKKTSKDQKTEFHIAIEYESALFQTKAGYEKFFGFLKFDQPGYVARMNIDVFEETANFVPSSIAMPASVFNAFSKLYQAIPESLRKDGIEDVGGWIRSLPLGVNYVTRHIYGLWHCTGGKDPIAKEYPLQWYTPYVRSMLRGAVAASRDGELISSVPIDGRLWAPQTYYPRMNADAANGTAPDEGQYGGAWSDYNDGEFVTWKELCGDFEEELLAGEKEE